MSTSRATLFRKTKLERFADALIRKAQEGVPVRLIYDWMGGFGKSSRTFWNRLRTGGVEVRCYNPPSLDSPLGWLSRDHRKMLSVDGQVGFITGLCVGRVWEGIPEKHISPWRDTGIAVRGPSVGDIEQAFAQVWAMMGEPLPERELGCRDALAPTGETALRVVASVPATAGMFRLDQLIAALARKRLWLTDAYYAGTPAYVQAMRAAAKDGVDVRLLVPNATEVVRDAKQKVCAPGEPRHPHPVRSSGGGSSGRAAAGVVRIGNAVGSAFTGRRVLESVEARLMTNLGVLLLVLAALVTLFPRVFVYPLLIIFLWLGVALIYKGYKLHREGKKKNKGNNTE